MDEAQRAKMIQHLRSQVDNIESIKNALDNVKGGEHARRKLLAAKFEVLSAIHEISWVGHKREIVKERRDVDDNPSAYFEEEDQSSYHVDYQA